VLLAMERLADARVEHTAALRLAAQAGDTYEQARAHAGLASSWQASGYPDRARRHWQEALKRYDGLGAPEADQVRATLTELALAR
jgi:tetratricopeptide (TPR) repeat protein